MHAESLSHSHLKEYVRWIEEAKRDETRMKRIAETVRMIAAGKKPR
ncbi:MAG: YdeI/OmpD-associated family protein [Anaerolineales bacterium]|nr:YdeI/OmpD-associated family protein [Anaerolineales bacterium]